MYYMRNQKVVLISYIYSTNVIWFTYLSSNLVFLYVMILRHNDAWTNEQHLIVNQFKELTTVGDGYSILCDFEFQVDNKHKAGVFKVVIIEGINDETAGYYIVKT